MLREMGRVESGQAGSLFFVQGILHIGEAMSPPVIRAVKEAIPDAELVILDAPPGTSCPVIETLRGSDYVILVTEPTPFGLNDLKLAVETVRALRYPFGVVINRAGMGFLEVQEYCQHQGIPILVEIPDERRIAEAYSTGQMICEAVPEFEPFFSGILPRITKQLDDAQGGKP